jgi:hypothetical protein
MTSRRLIPSNQAILRAELTGHNTCECAGITVKAEFPIIGMCRRLLDAGVDPGTRLECYRNGTLAISVKTIGGGALITVNSQGTNFEWLSGAREGSLVRRRRLPLTLPASAKEAAE